jgi:N-acetylglucosamine-6-phosphate deacetylase
MAVDSRLSIRGRELASGKSVAIDVESGLIVSVDPIGADDALPWIAPGLVDLQVNGYAGLDLNVDEPSSETIDRLTARLNATGVTAYLPTVVTASSDAIAARLRAIAAANQTSIPGIHLEGPFISPDDGPRGAHPRAHVQPPDWDLFCRWQEAAGGLIRMITLSPEWPEARFFIERCVATGVIVAIGHTGSTPEQIREAVSAGARISTHLGNGAHAVLPRHPNYLWEQLARDELWITMIADGFHLPESVLKVMIAAKGEKALLVSDVVALGGLPPGEYRSGIGERVLLTPEGRLQLMADPRLLAGSASVLTNGIEHIVRAGLASLADAWKRASVGPAAFLDLPQRAGLTIGAPADIVCFGWSGERIAVERVIKNGREVRGGMA